MPPAGCGRWASSPVAKTAMGQKRPLGKEGRANQGRKRTKSPAPGEVKTIVGAVGAEVGDSDGLLDGVLVGCGVGTGTGMAVVLGAWVGEGVPRVVRKSINPTRKTTMRITDANLGVFRKARSIEFDFFPRNVQLFASAPLC